MLRLGMGGADAGYRSEFLRFSEQRLTIAVLCNEPSSDPDRLVRSVADVYLDGAESAAPELLVSVPAGTAGPVLQVRAMWWAVQ